METIDAAHAFATLGHPGRLAVFRLLMRFAPQAVRPTDIARALGLKANTLSHHLADLVAAGLAQVDRRGRGRFYSVRLDRTEALLGYLALDVGRARPDLLGGLASAARAAPPPQDGHGWNVLFLCSGNSARSLLAEALLRDLGRGRFAAHSAGTRPGPAPHPHALEVLARNGHDIAGLRPKDLAQFRHPGAPAMNVVLTLCDIAAAEDCPPWPGQPITAHWGLPDPVTVPGGPAERARAFERTYAVLRRRIAALVELAPASLNRLAVQTRLDALGAEIPQPQPEKG